MQDLSAYCEALVRAADKDRFLAALFAAAEHRGALYALYAFNSRSCGCARAFANRWPARSGCNGGTMRSPAMPPAMWRPTRWRRPCSRRWHATGCRPRLIGLIAARRFDLYDDPMAKLTDFDDYAGATSSALLELAARILGGDDMPGLARLALHAGLGYAIAGLLQAFPIHAARGQLFLPLEVLQRHSVQLEVRGPTRDAGIARRLGRDAA